MAEFSAKMRELSDMINKYVATLENKYRPKLHEFQSYVNDNIELIPATDSGRRVEIQEKMGCLLTSVRNELNDFETRREQWGEIWNKTIHICIFLVDDSKWG